MSSIDVIAIVSPIVLFVFSVRDAIRGNWFGLNALFVAGAGFVLFKCAPDPFLGIFGLVVWLTAYHYAGLVIILGPILGTVMFIFDRPARRHW